MDSAIYFLGLLTAISFVISWKNCVEKSRKHLVIWLGFLLPFALRFAPIAVGLEWRAAVRSCVEWISAALMALWCVICIVHRKRGHFLLLTGMSALLCAAMVFNHILCQPVSESVYTQAGIPVYVRENNSPGSLADVRYYQYVNETFRKLLPIEGSYDALQAEDITAADTDS